MNDKLLEIKNLRTYFFVDSFGKKYSPHISDMDDEARTQFHTVKNYKNKIPAKAVDGVSFDVDKGEVLGIVGESGSGKSVTAYSITRLIPDPPGKIVGGEIIYKGIDLLKLSREEMKKYRGNEIAMIFQEPMTSLNPVLKIKTQLNEIILQHNKISDAEATDLSIEMMELVGIPDSSKRINDYPHSFSGGMRQRIMIAMALSCNPSLLIADEPTTALDVTIQAQIIDLMLKLKKERTDSAIMLITHNLGVVAETCQRMIIMYGGKIQEMGFVNTIFNSPKHPYTIGLLESIPDTIKNNNSRERLKAIPGMIPNILELPKGCKFCTRCEKVMDICKETEPEIKYLDEHHSVRCHLYQ